MSSTPATISAQVEQSEAQSVWLRNLPQAALNGIISNLQEGRTFTDPSDEALAVAFISDSLRKSVQKSLCHTLSIFNTEAIGSAQSLYASGIRELRICNLSTAEQEHPSLVGLLRSPTLETVDIPAEEHFITALLSAKSVKHLKLCIGSSANYDSIIALLRALPLRSLSLDCEVYSPAKKCLVNLPLSDPNHDNSIPELCPDLEELSIKCHRDTRHTIFHRLLPNLSLTRASLSRSVRKEAWHHLRGMESVKLDDVKDPVYHAERLGECVTEFVSRDILEDVDLRIMHGCPRLEVLHISVKVGQKDELIELIGLLPELRVLDLTFNRHTMYSGKRGRTTYDKMKDGDVLEMIKSASSLEEVALLGLQIPSEEMSGVLKHLGGRLRSFQTCLKGQEEGLFERLERLLEDICKYNYCLEKFNVWETYEVSSIKTNMRGKGKDLAKRRRLQRETGKRLMACLEVLGRRTRWRSRELPHHAGITSLVETLM